MAQTKIDWADVTINPITGCRNFGRSDICGDYCYAARMAPPAERSLRLSRRQSFPAHLSPEQAPGDQLEAQQNAFQDLPEQHVGLAQRGRRS